MSEKIEKYVRTSNGSILKSDNRPPARVEKAGKIHFQMVPHSIDFKIDDHHGILFQFADKEIYCEPKNPGLFHLPDEKRKLVVKIYRYQYSLKRGYIEDDQNRKLFDSEWFLSGISLSEMHNIASALAPFVWKHCKLSKYTKQEIHSRQRLLASAESYIEDLELHSVSPKIIDALRTHKPDDEFLEDYEFLLKDLSDFADLEKTLKEIKKIKNKCVLENVLRKLTKMKNIVLNKFDRNLCKIVARVPSYAN